MNKRTFLKTIGLASLIRPTSLFSAPTMDSWSQLANNRTVNGIQLQQAVNLGLFSAKTTIPQTERDIRCQDIDTYVNVIPVSGGQKLVLKGQLVNAKPLINIRMFTYRQGATSGQWVDMASQGGGATVTSSLNIRYTVTGAVSGITFSDTVVFDDNGNVSQQKFLFNRVTLGFVDGETIYIEPTQVLPTEDANYRYSATGTAAPV